jgi:hypothetical protein
VAPTLQKGARGSVMAVQWQWGTAWAVAGFLRRRRIGYHDTGRLSPRFRLRFLRGVFLSSSESKSRRKCLYATTRTNAASAKRRFSIDEILKLDADWPVPAVACSCRPTQQVTEGSLRPTRTPGGFFRWMLSLPAKPVTPLWSSSRESGQRIPQFVRVPL